MSSTRASLSSLLIALQVFLGGACVMALELLGSRLLAPRFGSTLYVWGSLIGVVMSGLAAGALVGGRLADEQPRVASLSRFVFAGGAAVVVSLVASPYVLDLAGGLPLRWGALVAASVLLGPSSFLLGVATPYAIRLQTRTVLSVGGTAGSVSALSTAGSIVGTFVTVFVLVPSFGVSALMIGIAVVLLVAGWAGMERKAAGAVFAVALVALAPLSGNLAERTLLRTIDVVGYETVERVDSPYHQIRVLESRAGTDPVRMLVMDGLRHSTMYVERPNETTTDYVYYLHLARLLRENLSDVLFVGAGGFSGPKKFLEVYPEARVDVVELDPEVVRVARDWFAAPVEDPRVRVFVEDGRRFLAQSDRHYDLVVLDAYGRDYVPFHLMTVEFFLELHDRVKPGGVVASNLIASTQGRASDILRAEVKTMQQAFPEVLVVPVDGPRGVLPQNVVILGVDAQETPTREALVSRARSLETPPVPGLATFAEHVLEEFDVSGAPVLRDDFAAVEMLLNPVTNAAFEK